LKKGEYTLEELLEIPREYLGEYLAKSVHLKNGPYGPYILWGEETVKIKTPLKKDIWEITLEDIITVLDFLLSYPRRRASSPQNISVIETTHRIPALASPEARR
jgi:topoisomerase IA-like protein